MRITKYEHACFVVEEKGQSLIVDPGGWSTSFQTPDNVTAIVITHEHPDHLDRSRLQSIINKNPDAIIVAHPDVTQQLDAFNTRDVAPNESIVLGTFTLRFYGGQHAVIAPDRPVIANLGVMINNHLYYPGDSFAVPENQSVQILALPVSAPWMKYSESMEFLTMINPKFVFPTHDAILSDEGKELVDRMVSPVANQTGAEYQRLLVGVSTEI